MTRKNLSLSVFLLLFIFLLATISFSQQQGSIEKIVVSKTEKTVEVRVFLSLFTYYRQFELSGPNRVVIDIFDTSSIKAPRFLRVNALGIRGIRTGRFRRDIARVVFDMLDGIPPYRIETIDKGLRILFWPSEEKVIEEKVIEEKVIEEKPEIEEVEDAICDMNVNPAKANPNDPIFVDMSGSQNTQSMEVEVFDKEGMKVTSQRLTPDSPKWETRFDKPGEYFFKGKAFNKEDKPSENLCEARTYINFPPISKLECSPCKDKIRKPITLDATGSTDPDGQVIRVDFEITDKEGNLVDRYTDNDMPFSWQIVFEDKGVFIVTAVSTDDYGAMSEPALIRVAAREDKKRLFILLDAGAVAARGEGTHAIFPAGRLGIGYKFLPGIDIVIAGGGAYSNLSAPWKSFYNGSLLLNFHLGPLYIGAGGGVTTGNLETLPKSYAEAVVNIGFDMFSFSKTKISLLFEGAGPVKDLELEDHYRVMAALRITF